jgi:hypothetical protein
VVLVIGFNGVMLWLLEVPASLLRSRAGLDAQATERAKAWVRLHGHRVAVRGLSALGALLVIKGIIGLIS